MSRYVHERPTVEVQFPDGPRRVPAHQMMQDYFGARVIGLTPDPMDGFDFHACLDGTWVATRSVGDCRDD